MNQNLTDKELKNQARILKDYLESCGVTVKHTQVLEGLARVHGWRNFATARASFAPEVVKPARIEHTDADTQNWVERILFLGEWWERDLVEAVYVYPKGVTLEQTGKLDLSSIRRLPDGYLFKPELSRADHIYAELPDLAYHGIPDWVDSRLNAESNLVEMGMGVAKEGVSLRRRDRGDDGAENYWITVRVPAAVSDEMDAACLKEYVDEVAGRIRETAADQEFAITRGTLEDLVFEESDQANVGDPTAEELAALRREFGF